jgi:chromatin remodeling complex protein RSC6
LRGKNISPDELRGKVSSMVRTRVNQLNEIAGSRASEYEEEREKEHEEKEAEKKEEENQEDEEDREEWGKEKKYSIETLEEKEARERVAKINL